MKRRTYNRIRHVGEARAIVRHHVKVVWEDTGWISWLTLDEVVRV